MKLISLIPILLLTTQSFGQDLIKVNHSCAYDGEESGREFYQFDPSDEADRIVSEICNAVSLSKNFTIKASNVKNALATTEGGQRYILYSTSFLEKFKSEARTRWAAYSVLAHEIGHHLNGHDFSEQDAGKRKRMELEADKFSGGVLRLLHATLEEAQAGIETFGLEGESRTHPPASARREAIASGWKKQDERLQRQNQPTTSTPTEIRREPEPVDKGKTERYPPAVSKDSGKKPDNNWNNNSSKSVTAQQLIGTWAADVIEFNVAQTIMIELNYDYSVQGVNGVISYAVLVNGQVTNAGMGYWKLEGNVFSQFNPYLVIEGIGSLRYINDDTFELTIINNGVPAYTGLKRIYKRIRL
ncbi:MAG: M48 family metalloprotease [Lewinellaceae bacterium]|nr:M48 family metalloprotease [Saprospiraceae bacterium]MCB9345476.1 M48 family metalloprotease [Lewinellaceae bacterium]